MRSDRRDTLRTADVFPVVACLPPKINDRKYVCGSQATVGSEQQDNEDLGEIYKVGRILEFITFYQNACHAILKNLYEPKMDVMLTIIFKIVAEIEITKHVFCVLLCRRGRVSAFCFSGVNQ